MENFLVSLEDAKKSRKKNKRLYQSRITNFFKWLVMVSRLKNVVRFHDELSFLFWLGDFSEVTLGDLSEVTLGDFSEVTLGDLSEVTLGDLSEVTLMDYILFESFFILCIWLREVLLIFCCLFLCYWFIEAGPASKNIPGIIFFDKQFFFEKCERFSNRIS